MANGSSQNQLNALQTFLQTQFEASSNNNTTTWYESTITNSTAPLQQAINMSSSMSVNAVNPVQNSNIVNPQQIGNAANRDIYDILIAERGHSVSFGSFMKYKRRQWNRYLQDPSRPQNIVINDPHLPPFSEMARRNRLVMMHKHGSNFQEIFRHSSATFPDPPN